jgi:hypothetical protein
MAERFVLERKDLDILKDVMCALASGRYLDDEKLKDLSGKIEWVLRHAQELGDGHSTQGGGSVPPGSMRQRSF